MVENFAELRRAMVDSQVRTTDVTELRLINALLTIPREAFVPSKLKPLAYIDEDLLVTPSDASPRYLMEPSPFAKLAQLAQIGPDDLVLDIGCATGYSSAVFSLLADAVIAVESDEELAEQATETLSKNGYDNVVVMSGDLTKGYAEEGPYDIVFIGGAVDYVPQDIFAQLKNGGRLVVIEGRGATAFAKLYMKDEAGVVSGRRTFNLAAKTLSSFEKQEGFSF